MLISPEGLLAQAREKAKPLHLRVTDLNTFIVNRGGNNGSNYAFVKIYTDRGLTGLGEGSVTSKEATVAAAIEEHKRTSPQRIGPISRCIGKAMCRCTRRKRVIAPIEAVVPEKAVVEHKGNVQRVGF